MNEFEDIEQLLKPQCEFKASDTLKQEVIEKARQEVSPRRIVRIWLWLVAACVVGFVAMFLTPPDPMSQLFMAIPLCLLYELSIWLIWLREKGRIK